MTQSLYFDPIFDSVELRFIAYPKVASLPIQSFYITMSPEKAIEFLKNQLEKEKL